MRHAVQLTSAEASRLRVRIVRVLDQLVEKYGKQFHCKRNDPLDELVLGLLSQNRSEKNSLSAYQALKGKYGNWNDLMGAPARDINRIIGGNGKNQTKALRLKRVLKAIERNRGTLDLGFLNDMDGEAGLKYMMLFKGVGHKLASRVLQFSLNKSVLPINIHINRIAQRLGWIHQGATSETTQILLKAVTPKYMLISLCLQLEKHGKMVCKKNAQRCRQCILKGECQCYRKNH